MESGQAVAGIVERSAEILHPGVAQDISEDCAYARYEKRQRHIVADQLHLCVAGGTQCSDDIRFLQDRVAGRDAEDERHDDHNNIEKDKNHDLVAFHIVAGEDNRLVLIAGDEALQLGFRGD